MTTWHIVCDHSEGLGAEAATLLSRVLEERLGRTVPLLTSDEAQRSDAGVLVLLCVSDAEHEGAEAADAEEYSLSVYEEGRRQVISLSGRSAAALYYGVVDLISFYLPTLPFSASKDFNIQNLFTDAFDRPLPKVSYTRRPAIRHRGVWTWAHCILDYRRFFTNMSLLKLNEVTLWVDEMPTNAAEVIAFAHALGIRVFIGFSWGWGLRCTEFRIADCFDMAKVADFAEGVAAFYREKILPVGADGIYFQSFTETYESEITGVSIAEAVVLWVSGISARLYREFPTLEIRFGLHATSVANSLECFASLDRRMKIVFEDCGAFPYAYDPTRIEDFDATRDFASRAVKLCGEGRYGCIYKGMPTLYWGRLLPSGEKESVFHHITEPFLLGEAGDAKVDALLEERREVWKYCQAEWIRNADYVRRETAALAEETGGDTTIQLLCEYGALEKGLFLPMLLASEMLWNPSEDKDSVIERVMRSPLLYLV